MRFVKAGCDDGGLVAVRVWSLVCPEAYSVMDVLSFRIAALHLEMKSQTMKFLGAASVVYPREYALEFLHYIVSIFGVEIA